MSLTDISNKQMRMLCQRTQRHIDEINRACGSSVSPKCTIIEHGGEFDCGILVRIEVQVDLPSRPVVNNIKAQEPVLLYFPLGSDFDLKVYSGRKDFPHLPHVMRRGKGGPAELCLFRTSLADWVAGKSFEDIIYRIRQWMADAAAGLLVKPDDPYEPLWVPMNGSLVEMDIDAAREKETPWQATAYEYKVEERQYFRITKRGGTLPVKVFYCCDVQTEPWSILPRFVSEVEEMFASAGFNIASDIASTNSKSNSSRFILILGVRRPKEILGRENSDEWIAFLFNRKKTKKGALIGASKKDRNKNLTNDDIWNVKCVSVRSVLTRQLAQTTSGWKQHINHDQQIAIIGAGALGSKVIMNLARSGLTNVLIIDKDIIVPHNLARHDLGGEDVGYAKAERLERQINTLYSNKPMASSFCKDVLIHQNELCEKLKPYKFVVDLSASRSVQSVLSNLRRENLISCPVISAFLGDSGRLAFVFIDGKSKDLTADVLETELISKHKELSSVKRWLSSGEDILQAGGGCRLITTIVPDTLITHAAGWISHNITNILAANGDWSENGVIGILETTQQDQLLSTSSKWTQVQSPMWFSSHGWKVSLPKRVEYWMKQKCGEAGMSETCGIFLGIIDRWSNIVFVTNAWEGPEDSTGDSTECKRGRKKLHRRLKDNLRDSGYREWYAGEWHSHPRGTTLASSTDINTSREIAARLKEFGIPAILLITNGSDISAYTFTHDN